MEKDIITVSFKRNGPLMTEEVVEHLTEAIESCKDKFEKRGVIFVEMPKRENKYAASFAINNKEDRDVDYRLISMRLLKLHPEYEKMKANGKLFSYDSFGDL